MKQFNNGKPFHGSEKISQGNLTGTTATDYFYFFCPECRDTQVLQILDFSVISEEPVKYAKIDRPKVKKDFTIAFELYCIKCELHDFVKISNTGWQGGKLKDTFLMSINKTQV